MAKKETERERAETVKKIETEKEEREERGTVIMLNSERER